MIEPKFKSGDTAYYICGPHMKQIKILTVKTIDNECLYSTDEGSWLKEKNLKTKQELNEIIKNHKRTCKI